MIIILMEISVIIILIFLNGFFALSELAILSSNKARMKILAKQGNKNAQKVLNLNSSPDLFLSTIQLWITLIGIISGVIGGVTLEEELNFVVSKIPYLNYYSNTISYIMLVAGITYLAVVFGEIVPKRVALSNPEGFALKSAGIVIFLTTIFKPIVYVLKATTSFIVKVTGIKKKDDSPVSEEELKFLLEEGRQKGIFEKEEVEIVENVLNLTDRRINEIMTHRLDFDYLEHDMTTGEILDKIKNSEYSRYPVIKENVDNIPGFVNVKDILTQYSKTGEIELNKLLIKPNMVKEDMHVYEVLEKFKQSGVHFGLVTNEHNLIEGLVTSSDILESVVGQLSLKDIPKLTKREDGSYLVDGLIDISLLKKEVGFEELPYTDENVFHTLGGFIINHLGIVPDEGESFTWNNWRFEIIDKDGNRIDKVLLRKEVKQPDKNEPEQSAV